MKRALALVWLTACGPSVPIGDDDDADNDDTTTDVQTSAGTNSTNASTSSPMTVTTTDATTAPADTTSGGTNGTFDGADSFDESDSLSFIENPDGGGICHCECDVWAQDCPKGDKCMPWANDGGNAWNATRCSPIDPTPPGVGEPCTVEGSGTSGIDDCELGAMCWGVDPDTLTGTCVEMCGGSEANPMCPDGLECVIAFEGTIIACMPPCDPLAPTCSDSELCTHSPQYDIAAQFNCWPTPPFVPNAYGQPCDRSSLQLCESGLTCAAPEHVPGCADIGCCTTLAELSQMPVCPDAMQTCIPFDDTMPDSGLCFCGVPE